MSLENAAFSAFRLPLYLVEGRPRRKLVTIPDSDTLRSLYDDEGKTVREIAALARCRPQTILAEMEAAGIARRRRGRRRASLPDIDP
jgi:hypothetical protein